MKDIFGSLLFALFISFLVLCLPFIAGMMFCQAYFIDKNFNRFWEFVDMLTQEVR